MTEKSLLNSGFDDISERYEKICEKIEGAMSKSGRKDSVRLMAVTKTVTPERINYAASLGIDLLGENRVQEFLGKNELYDKKCEIHFIGGLQNNKVKYIIDKVSMIQSVDSVRLADEISRRALDKGLTMDILIEVNAAKEQTKGGIAPEMLEELASYCRELDGIRLRGLMAIPPANDSVRWFPMIQRLFEDTRERLCDASFDTLSMGMSGDYEKAVEYGSTMVRIGSALFGYRK